MNHGGGRAIGDEAGSIRAELDEKAAEQQARMEKEMAELERDIHAATEGTLERPLADFVCSLETAEGTRQALLDEMTPEERRQVRQDYLEAKSRMVNVPAGVLDAVYTLEAAIEGFTLHQRRQALAHALWRSLASMNESSELWTESVTLRDGGRKVTFELSALWGKEE